MLQVKKILAKDNRIMPWLNDSGHSKALTRQIDIFPENTDLSMFDWRVSVADLQQDCEYSHFPETRRSQLLLSGRGYTLNISRNGVCHEIDINQRYQQVDFYGDDHVTCQLAKNKSRVFNLIIKKSLSPPEIKVIHGVFTQCANQSRRLNYIAQGEFVMVQDACTPCTYCEGDAFIVEPNVDSIEYSCVANDNAVMIEVTFGI